MQIDLNNKRVQASMYYVRQYDEKRYAIGFYDSIGNWQHVYEFCCFHDAVFQANKMNGFSN